MAYRRLPQEPWRPPAASPCARAAAAPGRPRPPDATRLLSHQNARRHCDNVPRPSLRKPRGRHHTPRPSGRSLGEGRSPLNQSARSARARRRRAAAHFCGSSARAASSLRGRAARRRGGGAFARRTPPARRAWPRRRRPREPRRRRSRSTRPTRSGSLRGVVVFGGTVASSSPLVVRRRVEECHFVMFYARSIYRGRFSVPCGALLL